MVNTSFFVLLLTFSVPNATHSIFHEDDFCLPQLRRTCLEDVMYEAIESATRGEYPRLPALQEMTIRFHDWNATTLNGEWIVTLKDGTRYTGICRWDPQSKEMSVESKTSDGFHADAVRCFMRDHLNEPIRETRMA